ncbi:DUF3010 family protein [Ochrobactrum chromiisoli]|uniref:DUF3010 family protein n=1 Tax=Ochrobactrum chromiisoli TaxID=2993941 RepID=A0ABT3QRX9_9HYPH|nr:DUF3010 family protein [Ochrobactrum chromiisoli]MCX2698340.1 DUF3010 family protein [Ochrobactrum chromiisoli]
MTITGSEANLSIVSLDEHGDVQHHTTETRKITLADEKSVKSLKAFGASITSFAHENEVDLFCIKMRELKGHRAGGGTSFKIEALIQLFCGKEVHFVHANTLKSFSKTNHGGVPAGLVGYLHDPFRAGAYYLINHRDK